MKSILIKEINSFFSSPMAYLVIGIYLLINGLFLWVFEGDFNILHAGFADLNSYFFLAPWIFLFLIPASTMKSFAEELHSGSFELLRTKPISNWDIILGKYFGAFMLIFIALVPTVIYVVSVYFLGQTVGNIDLGTTFGSFLGLLLLAGTYCAIGIFSSSITKNQIVAFITATAICFLFYAGFEAFSKLISNSDIRSFVQNLGMEAHFQSIGKGVIDTRDIIYFGSVILFFLLITKHSLIKTSRPKKFLFIILALLVFNVVGNSIFKRIDLTEDKRYTVSEEAKKMITDVEGIVSIQVYLQGDFPSEFKRLQSETAFFLEELKSQNKNILFQFINPEPIVEELIEKGLQPSRLQVQENGKFSELVIFPYAVVNYKEKSEQVSLLKDVYSSSQDEQLENSIQNLEYAFINAIYNVTVEKSKKVAVLKGNGTLDDIYIYNFLSNLGNYYHLAPFTLDSVAKSPLKTLEQLNAFDLTLIAKPTEKFSDEEKFVLDQYIMQGGKTLWLTENVQAEMDSLLETGETLAYPRDLGLTDVLFSYGVRVNSNLIADVYCSQIPLATGNMGNQTQFSSFDWEYFPLLVSQNNHPVNRFIGPVSGRFMNSIDTLKNDIQKTILLQSSPQSKIIGTPSIVSLKSITEQKKAEDYRSGQIPVAVLLEGSFQSAFKSRVKPLHFNDFKEKGVENKMIVISDGDIIANQLSQGQPLELGYDKYTNQLYGNKEFLLNAVSYLLDDSGIMNIRNKNLTIRFLDKKKAFEKAGKWQVINLLIPIALLLLFGLTNSFLRRRKYA